MAQEMKDSGVAWIGEIPAHWELNKLKTYTSMLTPMRDKPEHLDGDIPWIRIEDYDGKYISASKDGLGVSIETVQDMNLKIYPVGTILCTSSCDLGKCAVVAHELVSNQRFIGIIPNQDISSDFLYYLMLSNAERLNFLSTGSIQANLSRVAFEQLYVQMPAYLEQQAIAAYLDRKCAEIDAVLKKTLASIEEYKKLKQAVITQVVTKGIRENRSMKDSGIEWVKKIPTDWDVIPSRYLFRNSDERRHPDDELLTASQKYGIISQQQYMERENTGIVLATKGIENWKHVEPYDFIISLRSFQGGLEMSEVSGCITWHYIVLKPLKPIHSFYFKWLFKSELYIKAIQRTCNFIRDGQDLRYSNFVQVPLFIPPLEEQEEIADVLNRRCTEIDTLIQKKEQFISEMESYKKSLIYEYVTGKKEVPQA